MLQTGLLPVLFAP